MEVNFQELFNKVSDQVKTLANTETVIGEEFELGKFKCKPVIKLGVGFGSGIGSGDSPKGKGKGTGGGAGAGIGVTPLGFLVTDGEEISFVSSTKNGLSSAMEKVPDIIEKVVKMKEEKENKEK